MVKIYDQQDSTYDFEEDWQNASVRIFHQLGKDETKRLVKGLSETDAIIIEGANADDGIGGGGEIFPLTAPIFIGLSIFVITTKGFFDELGRELAKRLVSYLFDKNYPTQLEIVGNETEIIVIVPVKTPATENLDTIINEIGKIQKSGTYVYSEDSKSLITISTKNN